MVYCPGVPEFRKCPQCERENTVATWQRFDGKCPNCGDLFEKESSPGAAEGATPQVPKPIGGTVVSSKEWAERIISGLWNTGSNYEDFVREVAKALDSVRVGVVATVETPQPGDEYRLDQDGG